MIGFVSLTYFATALSSDSGLMIVLALIFVPLFAFINVLVVRLGLEVIAVIHRQRELLQEISNKLSR